jgi:hypothetical protein
VQRDGVAIDAAIWLFAEPTSALAGAGDATDAMVPLVGDKTAGQRVDRRFGFPLPRIFIGASMQAPRRAPLVVTCAQDELSTRRSRMSRSKHFW